MRLGLAVTVGMLLGVMTVLASQGGARAEPEVERQRDPGIRFACTVAKQGSFDPLFDLEGAESHDHTFFGPQDVNVDSTGHSLSRSASTSCEPSWGTASWWIPRLYDRNSEKTIRSFVVYYRGLGDQSRVVAPPLGLELLGNDGTAQVLWGCGVKARAEKPPKDCERGLIRQRIEFPDCWDGSGTAWDGGANVRFAPDGGACPESHPVKLPDHWITINHANRGGQDGALRVSAGAHGVMPARDFAHGDYIAGEGDVFRDELVERCIANGEDGAVSPEGCLFTVPLLGSRR